MAIIRVSTFDPRADFFNFNLKYLLYVGLWPNDNWNVYRKIVYRIYEITLSLLSITYLILTGIGTFINKEDSVTLLANMDKTIVAYNFVFKIMVFFIKRKHIRILIAKILCSGDTIVEERKRLMIVHAVAITAISTTITGVFQVLAQIKGEMIVDAWLPFDPTKNKMTLLMASQIIAILFALPCLYRGISIQGIVCSIIMYLCDQLVQLQERLKTLNYSKDNEAFMREEFKNIIKKHIRLMGYSKSLKEAFQEFFLIQNLAFTAELCLNALMVSIVGIEQKKHLITFMAFLSIALFNAFLFCHLGNELMDQSAGIALAAYEAPWTSWPVDLQKDLLIFITAAQRSFKLSAGGLALMSMQTYAQALYNGYSIFAVLRDVVN